MPGFFEKHKEMMRSAEQGADTIVWLSICDRVVEEPRFNGQFFFDREIASEHLPMCNTTSPQEHTDRLYQKCKTMCGL